MASSMKTVVIGESSGATMETIMSVYPRHKVIVDKYIAKNELIGIGPFTDRGNMAIFKSRTAAEQFVTEDPFILEGVVKSFVIHDWMDALLTGREPDKSFTLSIELSKSPDIIFASINNVSKWWGGKDLKGNNTKLNDEFIINHPGSHYSKQKVVEMIPDKKIVWLVTDSILNWLKKNQHEWTNTRLIFEISSDDNKTMLHFTHEGLLPQMECYDRVSEGWSTVIRDYLFNFICKGTPHFES
jgi:uncharacterized protein YciI